MEALSLQLPTTLSAPAVDAGDDLAAVDSSTEERDAVAEIDEQDAESTRSDTDADVGTHVDVDV